jgi:two-component sensor histidine kinase
MVTVTNIRLNNVGLVTDKIGTFVMIGTFFIPVYIVWSMVIMWKNKPDLKNRYIEIGLTVLLAGTLTGGLLNVPFPLMSVSNVVSLLFIGYAIIKLQILNPIRDLNEELQASILEKEVLLKEIHHRVKNNFNIITSLLHLQAKDIHSLREGKEALQLCSDRIQSMALVHEHLYKSDKLSAVDMKLYVENMANHLLSIYETTTNIDIALNINYISVAITQAVPCGLILNELISNALLHAFPDLKEGRITISINRTADNQIILRVGDDGTGIPESFDIYHPQSLGLQLVNILTEQLEGKIFVSTHPGTEVQIVFPSEGYEDR